MSILKVNISLRIWHPVMSSHAIVDAIGLMPRFSYSVGEPRRGSSDRDASLHEVTYVSMPLVRKVEVELDEEIAKWCSFLADKVDFLKRVVGSGGRAEFYVSIFLGGLGGFEFDRDALRVIHDLGLGICVEMYPDESDG